MQLHMRDLGFLLLEEPRRRVFRLIVKDIHAVHADLDTRCVTLHHQLRQAFSQISYLSSYTRTIPTQHRRSWELTGRRPTLHLSMPFRGSHPAPERMDKRLSRNLVLLSSSQHANQRYDCLDSSQNTINELQQATELTLTCSSVTGSVLFPVAPVRNDWREIAGRQRAFVDLSSCRGWTIAGKYLPPEKQRKPRAMESSARNKSIPALQTTGLLSRF